MKGRGLHLLIGLLITCGLLAFLIHGTDADVPRLRSAEFKWMFAATGLYGFCVLCRGMRMVWMESSERREHAGARNIVAVTTVHTAVNQIAPLRLGELTYAGLMKQYSGADFVSGLGITLRMRLADLAGLGLVTTLCALAVEDLPSGARPALVATGLSLSLVSAWLLLFGSSSLAPWLIKRCQDTTRRSHRIISSFALGIQEDDDTRALRIRILLSTVFLWFGIILVHWAIGRAFGLTLTPWEMGIVALGSIVLTFLPIATLGNFGTSEGGFLLGFSILSPSLQKSQALEIGMNIHIGLLSIVIFFGALALILVRAKTPQIS